MQPTLPAPTSLGSPLLPVQLPLECIQPALHVAPGTTTRARQGDVEEARGWGRASRQLLVLAPPTVAPKAENIGHPREGTWSRKGGVRSRKPPTPTPPPAQALPDRGLQVSLPFSPSSVKGSPPGGSPGGLGLEKGTRRRGLELRPGSSSSLLSGLEGPLDGLSPHGPPGCPRQLGPAPTRVRPCPKADTSPGCSVSVGNRE